MNSLDRTWRLWIVAALAATVLGLGVLSFVIVPLVGAQTAGLGAFAAICRAVGINLGGAAQIGSAAGPPATRLAWTGTEFAALAHADRAAGEALAQASCVACHAADGTSADPSIPRMSGQSAFAIYKELQDFKSGARTNETMSPVAEPLDPKQMAEVAAYYAGLRRTDLDPAHPSFAGPEIETLVAAGDAARALPPCAACHAPGAGGPIETPSLTGQSPTYVTQQLEAFASGGRHNDVFQRMRSIAAKLAPREMNLLGAYYTTPH